MAKQDETSRNKRKRIMEHFAEYTAVAGIGDIYRNRVSYVNLDIKIPYYFILYL